MIKRPWFLALFLTSAFHPTVCSAMPPKPLGFNEQVYVSDFAKVLDEKTKFELTSLINQTQQKTSAEIAVVTVKSLEGMSVEEYSIKLFKLWGIGKKKKDNGVLVLVAPNEKKMRIEVGYGLEAILPDGLCGQIFREDFTPAFKRGDYPVGVLSGVRRISQMLNGETYEPSPESNDGTWMSRHLGLFLGLFFSFFIIPGFIVLASGFKGKVYPSVLWGAMFGGIPVFMSLVFGKEADNPYLPFYCFSLAILTFVWTWRTIRLSKKSLKWSQGDWHSGSSSGFGGSFGGGGGFGGFGGGSSGGGGASGGW